MNSTAAPLVKGTFTSAHTTLRQMATAGAQGQRLAALIVGTRKEIR